MASKCAFIALAVFTLVLTHGGIGNVEARRNQGNNQRKTSSQSSSNSGHVTQPSYNTNNGNSHADVAKLSYPNYNSQPNRPATGGSTNTNSNNAPVGWNVPQGPPPAYSASNTAGGAHTNMHEPPPSYHAPNYGAAPPSYGAASGNAHPPITATQNHNQYSGAPSGGYPAGGYAAGGYPSGGYPAGGMPAGNYHPGGAAAGPPPGATYYQAGSALPPGATYYSQPPQQSSSGLGFGTGLLAGGLGGAVLGHVLTPSGSSSSQPAAAAPAAAAGNDRVIIINNGVPINASDAAAVVNPATGVVAAPAAAAMPANITQTDAPAQLAPIMPATNGTDAAVAPPPPPPAGGIICVPTKVNETDPADNTKMIEVEKVACYPAPPPPPPAEPVAGADAPAPLAPITAAQPGSQQMQQPAMLPPDQAAVRSGTSGAKGMPRFGLDGFVLLVATLISGGLLMRTSN